MTILLVLVGIAEPVGIILSIPSLRAAGRMTASSNAPLVFNQVDGIEFWANRYRFMLTAVDGSTIEIPVDNDSLSRLPGPHTRTAAYVVPIGIGVIAGPDFYLPPLQHGLCDRGPLAQALGYEMDLAGAEIVISSESSDPI